MERENDLGKVMEEVKVKSKKSLVSKLRREEYPIEFVYEDFGFFIGKQGKPTLKEAIKGKRVFT